MVATMVRSLTLMPLPACLCCVSCYLVAGFCGHGLETALPADLTALAPDAGMYSEILAGAAGAVILGLVSGPWKLLQSKRRVGLDRENAYLCRWS